MAESNGEAYVLSATHQSVTTIEFYHPQSNSLPVKLLEELAQAIHSAGNDPNAKTIILKSAGQKAFCAGASFSELTSIKTKEKGHEFFTGFARVINEMRKCPKFIIGRVHGRSVGGGVGLVAAMDYAIAMEGADIKLSELSIGFGPFVVAPAIERKIGAAAFSYLAIDATQWRNADWAKRKGLYAELHPDAQSMNEAVERLSFSLAHSSPEAMRELKKICWRGTEDWDQLLVSRAELSGKLAISDFTREAIAKLTR